MNIEAIERWFQTIDAEPQIICCLSNYHEAFALVEQGVGICIFPQTDYTQNPLIVTKLITDPVKAVNYALVSPKGQVHSALCNAFIEYVKDCLEEDLLHPENVPDNAAGFQLPDDATIL